MQRKIPMLLGKAYERHQRRTIGLTVLAALMVPLTAGTMLMLMPPARGNRRYSACRGWAVLKLPLLWSFAMRNIVFWLPSNCVKSDN